MIPFPNKKYRAIYADPPWPGKASGWISRSGNKKTPEEHYKTMTIKEIAALPVQDISAKDCLLFLWVRSPRLKEGLGVMESWGFEYKTIAFNWTKLTKLGLPVTGLGYWTRSSTELCLLGKKGKPSRINSHVPNQAIWSERGKHSEKPQLAYTNIEGMIEGPYIELFARKLRNNWDSWGDEI